jgi:hypothetical protein
MASAAGTETDRLEAQLESLRAPLMRFFLRRVRDAAEAHRRAEINSEAAVDGPGA